MPITFIYMKSFKIFTDSIKKLLLCVWSCSGSGNLSAEALCRRDRLPAQWVLSHPSVHFCHGLVFNFGHNRTHFKDRRQSVFVRESILLHECWMIMVIIVCAQAVWETADVPCRWSWRSWQTWTRPSSLPKSRMTENSGRISFLTL